MATPMGIAHAAPSCRSSKYMAIVISIRLAQISCIVCHPVVILSMSALMRVIDVAGSAVLAFNDDVLANMREINPPLAIVIARYVRCWYWPVVMAIPLYTRKYAPMRPYPTLFGSWALDREAKLMARCIKNGWQKLNAMRPKRGGTAESRRHLSLPKKRNRSDRGRLVGKSIQAVCSLSYR